jgi:hypothetical protein
VIDPCCSDILHLFLGSKLCAYLFRIIYKNSLYCVQRLCTTKDRQLGLLARKICHVRIFLLLRSFLGDPILVEL